MPVTTTLSKTHEVLMPYGINDLDPVVECTPGPPRRVRCYVGCTRHPDSPNTRYQG